VLLESVGRLLTNNVIIHSVKHHNNLCYSIVLKDIWCQCSAGQFIRDVNGILTIHARTRLTMDPAGGFILYEGSTMFFFLKRLIERLITLAIFAAIGAVAMGVVYDGNSEWIVVGALFGAGLVLAYWLLGGLFRLIFRGTSKAQLATIVDISSEAPPGAPWYHHAFVLFDIKGKRRKLKLTPEQARYFADHYSINDTGRLKWAGSKLIEFKLPTPNKPLKPKYNSSKEGKVFISYARGDDPGGQTAEYLEQVFNSAGLITWVDKNELAPGGQVESKDRKENSGNDVLCTNSHTNVYELTLVFKGI